MCNLGLEPDKKKQRQKQKKQKNKTGLWTWKLNPIPYVIILIYRVILLTNGCHGPLQHVILLSHLQGWAELWRVLTGQFPAPADQMLLWRPSAEWKANRKSHSLSAEACIIFTCSLAYVNKSVKLLMLSKYAMWCHLIIYHILRGLITV